MKYPNWVYKLPYFDKWIHAVGFSVFYLLLRLVIDPIPALFICTVIAWAKEWIYDASGRGTKDWWDFWAGVVPVLVLFTCDITLWG